MYLIRKQLIRTLLNNLSSNKPYWLFFHFCEFCEIDVIAQTKLLLAISNQKLASKFRNINVRNIDESLDFILEKHCSVVRFGDGEFDIIAGLNISYQSYNVELASELKQILTTQSDNNLLVCLPDVFRTLEPFNDYASNFWREHLTHYQSLYEDICSADWYGCTFISRPYIDWKDKSKSADWFKKLKSIWDDKSLLIVEGKTSRSGVGNDLFNNAKSIQRIICPSKNAYAKLQDIKKEILVHAKNKVILLMLGPTAKVLVRDLTALGYQAIDIGHIDSEYEWFKMGVTKKTKLAHKHTAEFNQDKDITFIQDKDYDNQIIIDLSE